jgi:hypothetical protein
VTGNPGAVDPAPSDAGSGPGALVLLQGSSASLLTFDVRASKRYVDQALAGLAAAAFTGPVVMRPHALDPMDYSGVNSHGLRASVESGTSIPDELRRARLCIGTVSTATLEAAAAGVPTVFLDVTGVGLPWPFDRSGALPTATDSASLAHAIRALQGIPGAAREAAREALGARPDALSRVVELVVAAAR